MKYSLQTQIVLAMLGPLLLAVAAIVSVAAYDLVNDPLPLPDGGSTYKPLLSQLLGPIWFCLLVAWVILGSIIGKQAGQRKGEVIGALAGAVLALFVVFGYLAVNS
jgi:hypothetical protein